MNRTTPLEFARYAWDFRDAAVGAEHLLGERDEYQLHASLPVAYLFGTCIDLALRSCILAMDPASTQAAGPECLQDSTSLVNEANKLGLARLVSVDECDQQLLGLLNRLRSTATSQYCTLQDEEIFPFEPIKKLSEKLLDVASAMAGYERTMYE